ncbi:MAG: hypothetical protein Ta2B_18490 [Termitinemataceae bacterium]|nr:MAG: hypothetical protein Ta2B_18490 [Termitinemataceae bacterium]
MKKFGIMLLLLAITIASVYAGSWKCLKCGNSTWSHNKPLVGYCSKGGGHNWEEANDGAKVFNWRCEKCGNSAAQGNKPLDRPCTKGGICSWIKQKPAK